MHTKHSESLTQSRKDKDHDISKATLSVNNPDIHNLPNTHLSLSNQSYYIDYSWTIMLQDLRYACG